MIKKLDNVVFWFSKDKCSPKDHNYAFITVSQFADPEIWKELQKIFEKVKNKYE